MSLDDNDLSERIGLFVPGTSKKRKGEFQSMDEFYDALTEIADWDEEDTAVVKNVFKEQII